MTEITIHISDSTFSKIQAFSKNNLININDVINLILIDSINKPLYDKRDLIKGYKEMAKVNSQICYEYSGFDIFNENYY